MSSSVNLNSQRFIPGQMFVESGDIELNVGRNIITLEVSNSGDRPIQIGSHFHFFEVNDALLLIASEQRECDSILLLVLQFVLSQVKNARSNW